MAHAAIAFAKASRRKRMMACTTSIGPGATNMVTAAAVAHVNRLPVLLIPGRRLRQPQARSGAAAGRGVRRRHGQRQRLLPSGVALFRPDHAARADRAGAEPGDGRADRSGRMRTGDARLLPGRSDGGLRLPRDVLRASVLHRQRRVAPDPREVADAAALLQAREEAALVMRRRRALFRRRAASCMDFCASRGIPVGETQAGKSATPADHPLAMARSASPAPAPPMRSPRKRTSSSASARVCGFHDWLLGPVQESGPPVHRDQRPAVRRSEAPGGAGRRRRARRAGRARRRARRLARRRAPGPTPPPRPRPTGMRPPPATSLRPMRPCRPTPKCSAR